MSVCERERGPLSRGSEKNQVWEPPANRHSKGKGGGTRTIFFSEVRTGTVLSSAASLVNFCTFGQRKHIAGTLPYVPKILAIRTTCTTLYFKLLLALHRHEVLSMLAPRAIVGKRASLAFMVYIYSPPTPSAAPKSSYGGSFFPSSCLLLHPQNTLLVGFGGGRENWYY